MDWCAEISEFTFILVWLFIKIVRIKFSLDKPILQTNFASTSLYPSLQASSLPSWAHKKPSWGGLVMGFLIWRTIEVNVRGFQSIEGVPQGSLLRPACCSSFRQIPSFHWCAGRTLFSLLRLNISFIFLCGIRDGCDRGIEPALLLEWYWAFGNAEWFLIKICWGYMHNV